MIRLILSSFVLVSTSYAQWSTSTRAESTLYVCPGFYPGIVTFDDGSSIVLGALQSYIYARKLDDRGYYLWPPIQVMHNDSSFITETPWIGDWGGWISDGDRGVILFWYDHRGAYINGPDWANNAIYVQRVDRFGVVRWTPGGVLVKGPQTGKKDADIVPDGAGGFILVWAESRFGYPGASNREYLMVGRYDGQARGLWEVALDSSTTQYALQSPTIRRGGRRVYVNFYFNLNPAGRILDTLGNIVTPQPIQWFSGMTSVSDSAVYLYFTTPSVVFYKIGSAGDTVWGAPFTWPNGCSFVGTFVPDSREGVHFLYSCNDTIFHFDSTGVLTRRYFGGISSPGGFGRTGGDGGIVIANQSVAKRYNEYGLMIWPSPVMYLRDPANAYFARYEPDNNGGLISVFWTTRGGIFAQHTGRYGQVGIITAVMEGPTQPLTHELSQNFPNPFNSSTVISYSLSRSSRVHLDIFDVLGRRLATPVNAEDQQPGKYQINVTATNLSTGIYLYRLKLDGNIVAAKKMLLVK